MKSVILVAALILAHSAFAFNVGQRLDYLQQLPEDATSLPPEADGVMYQFERSKDPTTNYGAIFSAPIQKVTTTSGRSFGGGFSLERKTNRSMTLIIRSNVTEYNKYQVRFDIIDKMFQSIYNHRVRVFLMPADIWIETYNLSVPGGLSYATPIHWIPLPTESLNLHDEIRYLGGTQVKSFAFKSAELKSKVNSLYSHYFYGWAEGQPSLPKFINAMFTVQK